MSKHIVSIWKAIFCAAAVLVVAAPVLAAEREHEERGESREHREERSERGERHEESKFYGAIEVLPQNGLNGTWRVSGRDVVVTERTLIKEEHGKVAVGVQVEVQGGGTPFTAYEIEVKTGDRR